MQLSRGRAASWRRAIVHAAVGVATLVLSLRGPGALASRDDSAFESGTDDPNARGLDGTQAKAQKKKPKGHRSSASSTSSTSSTSSASSAASDDASSSSSSPSSEAPAATRATAPTPDAHADVESPEGPPSATVKSASLELGAYDDSDHVAVLTPSVRVGVDTAGGLSIGASYLVDVVSAASVDVISTASSRWKEVRQAGAADVQFKPGDFGVAAGGSISSEPDYLAWGAYGKVIKDFDQKNWTITLGYGYSHDTAGRCAADGCAPFSVFSRNLQRSTINAGVAWVADPRSVLSLGADFILEDGDQSKPYRYVPMFAPNVASSLPRGASIALVNADRLPERPLEQLPLTRQRGALVLRYAHRFDGSTARVEERGYNDSWGLFASTTDLRWIFDVGRRMEIWPHLHFHAQSPVSFWQRAYASGAAPNWSLPEYRTGDRELGPLWTADGGLGVRFFLGGQSDPEMWAVALTADGAYTDFLDDLYLTNRVSVLGALTLEVQW